MTQDADIKLIAKTANKPWCWKRKLDPVSALWHPYPHITDYFKLIEWASGQKWIYKMATGEYEYEERSWGVWIDSTVGGLLLGITPADECKERLTKIIAAAIRSNHEKETG